MPWMHVNRAAGRRAAACGVAGEVRAFAEGVPLWVEEFLSSVLQDGSLRAVDGDWSFAPATRPRPPASLRESVEVRVGRLGPVAV